MRVTDKMMFDNAAVHTAQARERLERAVEETSTGKRLHHPADDPAAAGQVSAAKLSFERLDMIRQNAGRATDELQAAHGALQSVSDVLGRARQLAVQLANVTYDGPDRANAATEIDGIFAQVVGVMNAQVGNRRIFGGFQDDAAPFAGSGAYLGDAGVRQIEIAPGVRQNVSVRADVALKGVGGGTDVFATLTALATALRSNDTAGIGAAIGSIDSGLAQVAGALTDASTQVSTLTTAAEVNQMVRDQVTSQISRLADADIVESSTKLALANRALEASMAAAAKGFDLSLVTWLR